MKLEKSELKDLLSGEAEKERRALKRTILPIAITALVGLFWLGFSGYKVVSLERESSHLTDQIQDQKTELNRLQDNITTANDELAYTNEQLDVAAKRLEEANRALAKVEETLNNIAAGKQDPVGQAERALEKIPNASKSVDSPRAGPSPPFLMAVEDVFTIQGRGTIALGRVERGKVKLNEPLEIVGLGPTRKTVVKAIDMFRKLLDEAIAGDNVGLILEGVARTDIKRGQVLAKPGSIEPHKKFRASISMRTKEEGGRQIPIPTGYRPQFYFRTLDVTGVVKPLSEKEIAPGDKNIDVEVELLLETIAMEQGQRFAIREGGRTVGTGVVTRIIE